MSESFGPSPGGWTVIFAFFLIGLLTTAAAAVWVVIYLVHHLHWIA